jgi:hypothetical protein
MNERIVSLDRKRDSSGKLTAIAWVAYGSSLLIFLSLAFVPQSWVTEHDWQLQTITIVNPSIIRIQWILALSCFVLLLLLGVLGLTVKKFSAAWVALLIAMVGFPASCGKSITNNLGPWTTEAELNGPDNQTYYFMDSSFMQGQTMAIARLKEHTWFTRHMEVLGTTNGDNPRSWASVIRPAGVPVADYGQLYLSSDKTMLIGIRSGFACYMSYSFQSNHFRGNSDEDNDDIKGISPFILIGEDMEMNAADVKEITDLLNSHTTNNNNNGYPRLNVLEADLNHPNIKVRSLARELMGIIRSNEKSRVIRQLPAQQSLAADGPIACFQVTCFLQLEC